MVLEQAGGDRRSVAARAVHDGRCIAIELVDAVEERRQAHPQRARDRAVVDLTGIPDVDHHQIGRIAAEWQRTRRLLLEITGQAELLGDNPALARSIRNRFPYLDPLNHLQVELLRRYRAGETDERTRRAIHLTINGVAAGLRNSG